MLSLIRRNIVKRLNKKLRGFLMIQTALALITLGAMAVSFFQIYGGQFAAMAAAKHGALCQQAADIVAEYYQMADYDSLSTASIPKSGTLATLFGAGNISSDLANLKFTCTLGAEKNFTTSDGTNSGNLRLATINIMNPSETAPRATITVPLSSAGVGSYYVKNNTKKTAGIASVSYSDGYLYGYVNGTQYPFYFNGYTKTQSDANYYKKTETYTKAQVDSLINGLTTTINNLQTTYLTSNYFVRNGNSSKPFTLTYQNENSSIKMPEGKAIYANVLGMNVPLSGGSGSDGKPAGLEDGWLKLDNGLILQWGFSKQVYGGSDHLVYNSSLKGYPVPFKKPFPNGILFCSTSTALIPPNYYSETHGWIDLVSYDKTKVVVSISGVEGFIQAFRAFYFAIGY